MGVGVGVGFRVKLKSRPLISSIFMTGCGYNTDTSITRTLSSVLYVSVL